VARAGVCFGYLSYKKERLDQHHLKLGQVLTTDTLVKQQKSSFLLFATDETQNGFPDGPQW